VVAQVVASRVVFSSTDLVSYYSSIKFLAEDKTIYRPLKEYVYKYTKN
jgi:hypothetical protein